MSYRVFGRRVEDNRPITIGASGPTKQNPERRDRRGLFRLEALQAESIPGSGGGAQEAELRNTEGGMYF